MLAIHLEGESVVGVADLLEGFLCGAVEFELEDVAVEGRQDDHVDAAFAGMVLGLGVGGTRDNVLTPPTRFSSLKSAVTPSVC